MSVGRLRIIALVGIDGSGKTTLAMDLTRWLDANGIPAEYSENPGGRLAIDRFARRLGRGDARRLLGRRLFAVVESCVRWLAIARGLLLARLKGRLAVMDRYSCCQVVVMRAREDPGMRWVRRFYGVFPDPDATFFMMVPPETAKHRIDARGYDSEPLSYLSALDYAYRTLPEFREFIIVDADAPLEVVQQRLRDAVRKVLDA